MTHQNHQTNGASLEDCHTNFFALTELYGIKWRKLVWGETVGGGGGEGEEGAAPLGDPVISSYARCLAGDILCVWRRVPAPQPQDIYEMSVPAPPPPPLSLRAAKELWIFWYGEEPDLNGLVAPELITGQGDQGSWESGLSYECRSLLFKALHNLIERCLLSRDFVRLGKWFVQPYDGDEEDVGKSPWHLSFSFAFFLHGESTVCASVDVRQHPPVRTLTAKRLAKLSAREPQADPDNKVILAPFGLEGTVTGRDWSDSDAATARLLDAWRQLYPLEQGCGAVEVLMGGVRMRYPLPYVLVTGMEPPPAPPPPAAELAARAAMALTTPRPSQPADVSYGDTAEKFEDFVDPTRKTPCTCAKWRRRRAARAPAFHRRAAPARAAPRPAGPPRHHTPPGGCLGAACAAASPGSCGGGSPAAAVSAPSSAGAPPPSPHTSHLAHTAAHSHQSACVPTTLHTPAPTPETHAPPTPAPPSAPPPTKLYNQNDSPRDASHATTASPVPAELLKRPVLPRGETRVDPLEDEHSLHMLYDYTTVHAWLEHPVKRFKTETSWFREELALGSAGGDLYAGHDHTHMPAMPDHAREVKQERPDHDTAPYPNLFTSDGLCPTLKDLEQIFDNSDDASGDESVRLLQVQTPPDSNKSTCEEGRGRMVRAEELSKMFPTPPSLEAHAQPSPGFTLDALDKPHHLTPHATPPHEPIEDWSYVFKPPTVYKCHGSSKYAPLTALPSHSLPPVALPPHAVYRPRWQHDKRDGDQPATQQTGTKRPAAASPAPAEAAAPRSVSAPPGASPARAPSPAASPPPRAARRACPLLLNVLLADTVLNVFRDHNFDSCTLCVCNAGPKVVGNIRGADSATYLPGQGGGSPDASPAPDEDPGRCTCGFSAVVNRRLAHNAGLFYEDEMEITGIAVPPGRAGPARAARPPHRQPARVLGRRGGGGAGAARGGGRGRGRRRAPLALHRRARAALLAGRRQINAAAPTSPPRRDPEALLRRAHVGRRDGPAHVAAVPPAGRARQRGPVRAAARAAAARGPRPRLDRAVALRAAPLGAPRAGALLLLARRRLHRPRGRRRRPHRPHQDVLPGAVDGVRGAEARPAPTHNPDSPRGLDTDLAQRARPERRGVDGRAAARPPRRVHQGLRGDAAHQPGAPAGEPQDRQLAARHGVQDHAHGPAGPVPDAAAGDPRPPFRGRRGGRAARQPHRVRLLGGRGGRRPGPRHLRRGAPRHARLPRAGAALAAATRCAHASSPQTSQSTRQDNLAGGRVRDGGHRRRRALGAARAGLQRVHGRAPAAGARARRQVAHRLRHRRAGAPAARRHGRKEPRALQTVLAGVGAGAAARSEGGRGDVGAGGRAGLRAVPVLLPVARPALAAGRRHRRARRAAGHRRHQHTRAAQIPPETDGAGAALRADQADGLGAGRDEPGRAAVAARGGPARPHRPRRAQGLELAAVAQEPGARVGRAARDLRQLRRAVPGGRAVHPVGVPGVHGARPVPAAHGRPLHARRALLAGLHPEPPAHAPGRHRHAHTRVSHLGHHAVEPDAVRAADGERRGGRHDVPGRGHERRGHGRGQHDGPAHDRHVQQHVAAGLAARLAAPPRRRRARGRARAPAARAQLRAHRPLAGASGHGAAAAAGAGLPGVDGAAGRHAGVVVGGLRAPARRLPRLPQDGAAAARRPRAGRRRLHQPHAAPPPHAPARLHHHHRRAQIRVRGLQRAVVARSGRRDARPALLPAAARAGADAAVPYRRRAGLSPRARIPHPSPRLPPDATPLDRSELTLVSYVTRNGGWKGPLQNRYSFVNPFPDVTRR